MAPRSFGNWEYERMLGSGGFGQVELWKQKYTHKKIAIKKCMLPITTRTPRQMQRWKQEIENMKNFKHPNIVKSEAVPAEMVFESPVLCMEFCNKGDLRKVLLKPENACGLIQSEVLSVMKDISSALKYLHFKRITHRDLKPENIVLHETKDMVIYKLIDLGYAKELGNRTTTASLVGTFNYVAPELFWKKRYTCSVDYWSLGILFFEVVTGYKPFLPYLENFGQWMTYMENKKNEEICAREINGKVEFYNYIIHPNDLSENLVDNMIKWFQIVLQWDPRQRGKCPGSDEVVVFPLLKEMFPFKTIYIFSVSLYRMDQYNANIDSTLIQLQQWIEQKTSVSIKEQTITDIAGNVLNKIKNSDALKLKNIHGSMLYVYKNDSLEVIDADNDSKIPPMLDVMLVKPGAINNRSSLKQCYTALIYVMRHEVMLFKEYTFALGTKLDMINTKLNILKKNIQKSLPNAISLLSEVNTSLKSIKPETKSEDIMSSIHGLFKKIKTLNETIDNVKVEMETAQRFSLQIKEFFESEKLINSLQQYSKLYEDVMDMFHIFDAEKMCSSEYIIDQVNTLSEIFIQFDEQKNTQLQEAETIRIISQLNHLEKKLHSHLEVINSATELIPFYKTKFSELLSKSNQCSNFTSNILSVSNHNPVIVESSLVIHDDTEIIDNIVLRAVMDKYLQDIEQNWSKITL